MGSRIVVGIPAYNEERAIADIVARALSHAAEVVVVDDGSADLTALRALKAGATVIRHRVNLGKGAAVAALFQYAIDHMADVLVLLDGDGQHDPGEIPTVAAPCVEGWADVVVGSRFLAEARSATPFLRRLGQHAFNAMTTLASGVRCSDSQSGFRAFRRRAFCAMRLAEASFSVECEMQFEVRNRGLCLAEVPISCRYDQPPKRNVVAHGAGVLTRLTSMALRRRMFGRVPSINPSAAGHRPLRPAQTSELAPREILVATTAHASFPASHTWSDSSTFLQVNWPVAPPHAFEPEPFRSEDTVGFERRDTLMDAQRTGRCVDYETRTRLRRPFVGGLPECVGIGRGPPGAGGHWVAGTGFVSLHGLF